MKLDFPDQSHINRVRDALWQPHAGRASVMIGSGFSKNCDIKVPGVSAPPNWDELVEAMRRKLYPTNQICEKTTPPKKDDPLQFAEQYHIAFGREELNRLVRQQIRDEQIEPGEFHRRLLSLPWQDVFTTNWDTLLERTSEQVFPRTYGIVREVNEIPLNSPPRIVKLHGSLPSSLRLIATQEDYRTYPTRFAPFVNTVQQAMMETVFLLVGFSGRDPNFLHWSGWVRDKLGDSAPHIYAAGWLNLSVHERRVLESRNVIPIDLARHPRSSSWGYDQRHRIATDWILKSLELGEPYPYEEWPKVFPREDRDTPTFMRPVDETPWQAPMREKGYPPELESDGFVEAIMKQLACWDHNRELYPGWLTIPGNQLVEIALATKRWEPAILEIIPDLEPAARLNALRLLIWRNEIASNTISREIANFVERELNDLLSGEEEKPRMDSIGETLVELAVSLVTYTRLTLNAVSFNEALKRVEDLSSADPEIYNRLYHEKCLWAIWDLDFEQLESALDAWDSEKGEPFWAVRKAALLLEIGRDEEADALLRGAINDLRRGRSASPTIPVFSRQAWAHYLLNKLQNEPGDFADESYHSLMRDLRRFNCDPEDDVKYLSRELLRYEEEKRGPAFDLEQRQVRRTTLKTQEHYISGSFARQFRAADRAIRFGEINALPPNAGFWSVTGHILGNAARVLAAGEEQTLALRLMLRITNSDENELLKTLLSRPKVARMPSDLVETTVDLSLRVVDYFLARTGQSVTNSEISPHDRVRVAMESVSRLVLRLQPEKVCEVFASALEYYRTPSVFGNLLIHSAIWNLLKRSWEALPQNKRTDFVFDVLNSPILGVDGFEAERFRFIDPGQLLDQYKTQLPVRNGETEARWRDTIRFIVHSLGFSKESRSRAMLRLVKIAMGGILSESEKLVVAEAVWNEAARIQHGLPGEEDIRHWIFLCMPEPEPGAAMAWFRNIWLSVDDPSVTDDPILLESALFHLGDAIERSRDQSFDATFLVKEEEYILRLIQRWARVPLPPDFSLSRPIFDHARVDSIKRAINGVTTLLLHFEIPNEIAEELFIKHENLLDTELFGMALLVGLSKHLPDKLDEIDATFRKGLSSENENLVYNSAHAMEAWLHFAKLGVTEKPSSELIREIGFAVAIRRRRAVRPALQTTRWIFEKGDRAEQDSLSELTIEGLGFLIHELDYANSEYEDMDAVPDMRWNCVAIARAMHNSGCDDPIITAWLRIAEEDPLPEVRFAVSDVAM